MTSKYGQGGCQCGAVRYEYEGDAEGSMICHCRTCRRVSGAPVVAWVTFPVERVRIVQGQATQFSSSASVRRTFCAACGTPLTYQHADEPQFIDVTTCSLDEPEAFAPTHHSWIGHDLDWMKTSEDLPKFVESRYGQGPG